MRLGLLILLVTVLSLTGCKKDKATAAAAAGTTPTTKKTLLNS